mmetsp:Transcript_9247/g.18833  ORF Transcript_9247/g.18833 Transcript_9247/m.18833 type:complete len:204 (-) Transcript_9247:177-788(-)
MRTEELTGPFEVGPSTVRAWRPNLLLERVIEGDLRRNCYPWILGPQQGRVALDVGCGSGRDLVYLAEHLPPEWSAVGVDNHSYALDRALTLAKRRRVRVKTRLEDLRKPSPLSDITADLILGCRFLHRPLLSIIRDRVSERGTDSSPAVPTLNPFGRLSVLISPVGPPSGGSHHLDPFHQSRESTKPGSALQTFTPSPSRRVA